LEFSIVNVSIISFLVTGEPPGDPEFHYITGSAIYQGIGLADGAHVIVRNERTSEHTIITFVVIMGLMVIPLLKW
jgi:hypothetical protein